MQMNLKKVLKHICILAYFNPLSNTIDDFQDSHIHDVPNENHDTGSVNKFHWTEVQHYMNDKRMIVFSGSGTRSKRPTIASACEGIIILTQ